MRVTQKGSVNTHVTAMGRTGDHVASVTFLECSSEAGTNSNYVMLSHCQNKANCSPIRKNVGQFANGACFEASG